MKLYNTMIGYNPGTGEIEAGIHPDVTGWSRKYEFTVGACYASHRETSPIERKMMMFINFHAAVVRDKVDIDAAHHAFLTIDEYRESISPDIEGATPNVRKSI